MIEKYGCHTEFGFYPDEYSDVQEGNAGSFIVLGNPYSESVGNINIGFTGKSVELPPEPRRTAQTIGRDIDGTWRARPTTTQERSGDLPVTLRNTVNLGEPFPICYKKSSIKLG